MAVSPAVTRWIWCAEAAILRTGGPTLAQILAQIDQESGGDPRAVSSAGAQGLMQLMPETAKWLGVANPMDPLENVMGGVRYMHELMGQFHDWKLALAAYNAGPGAVEIAGNRVPDIAQTQQYVASITAMAPEYQDWLERSRGLPGLSYGSTGDAVRVLQQFLGMAKEERDGVYGEQTLQSVLSAKEKAGLPRNGVVGDGLWSYLLWVAEGGMRS